MSRVHRMVLGLLLALSPVTAFADPGGYGDGDGYTLTPPYDSGSFTTIIAAFPAGTTRIIDGYPAASRLLAATGHTLYLLQSFGSSDWLPAAILAESDPSMDPAFVAVAPNGEKIALGSGLGKPLYVFPTTLLSVDSPAVLTTSSEAHRYDGLNYYSAAFRDGRYLFVNAGGDVLGQSLIYAIDTEASATTVLPILDAIPGASGGVAFDAAGDLVTGLGWDPDDMRTGELKIFDATSIDALLADGGATPLDYDAAGHVLAEGMLSADPLGFDGQGNLYVGGGDVFGSSGHYGYVNLIDAAVVSRVLAGGAPADADDPSEVGTIAPDPCRNDDRTTVAYVPGVDMLLVSANLASLPPNCEGVDWSAGPTGALQVYFPPGAPDSDGDGIPDGVDPDYEARRYYGPDELSRLVNALDATAADPSFDAAVDYDADGAIGDGDFAFLRAHWGAPVRN